MANPFTYYPPTTNGLQKTLDASLAKAATASATFNSVTGIQNKKGIFVVDRVDANGNTTDSKREYISFEAVSGSTVTTLVRGLGGSTDQDHAVGAIVEFCPDVVFMQAFINLLALAIDVDAGTVNMSTFATPAGTQTLTNKRITKRVGTATSAATHTIDCDDYDMYTVTAQGEAVTFAAPEGTPTQGQTLVIRIKDDATARGITWNSIFRAGDVALPTTTVLSKTMYCGFMYNTTDTKWDLLAYVDNV